MLTRSTVIVAGWLAAGCGSSSPGPACSEGAGWQPVAPVIGGPIQETAVVSLDDRIYVLGGFTASIEVVPSVRIFDAATCRWSDGPPLPRAIHHANAVVAGDTLYVVGATEATTFVPIGDVWAWTPGRDATWRARTAMPIGTERGAAVAGVIDGEIYVAGGYATASVATLSAYSIADDRWDDALPPLPESRDHACGGVIGGKLYVAGGRMSGASGPSGLVFEYAPGGAWSQRAAMPTARGGIACGIAGDRIVVAGGEGNLDDPSGVFSQVEAYTVSRDRWDALVPMATPRHGMGGAVIDGVMYVPGGATRGGFGAVDTHEALRL
jgi:N-acetylneuraminic acid mutarotase